MTRYYSFETAFVSLRDELRRYLHDSGIYYELSGAAAAYHFEILATDTQAEAIDAFLDSVTIWCKGIA